MSDSELFELCKEVYKHTGWRGGDDFCTTIGGNWIADRKKGWYDETIETDGFYPLYSSDYLLEKLPITTHVFTSSIGATAHVELGGETFFGDGSGRRNAPLKALLKLTIALHEAGELK